MASVHVVANLKARNLVPLTIEAPKRGAFREYRLFPECFAHERAISFLMCFFFQGDGCGRSPADKTGHLEALSVSADLRFGHSPRCYGHSSTEQHPGVVDSVAFCASRNIPHGGRIRGT